MEEFEKLLEAFRDYTAAIEERRQCYASAEREAGYYCSRYDDNLSKAKVNLKDRFDSYIRGL